jgi:hypothetical protein
MKNIISILLITISLIAAEAEQTTFEKFTFKSEKKLTDEELKNRVLYTNLVAAGAVTVWGTVFWDYFSSKPVMGDEGWFGKDTKYGGADKLGHLHSSYLFSLGFSSLYEYWGLNNEDAIIYGPLTAWMVHGVMELGDSFSKSQGFSYEDLIMNTLGATFYYVREKYPSVKKKLDLRLEYIPDFQADGDIFTQYDSMKYLLALKFSGFESMESNFMKYGELQAGYYTRGYQNNSNDSQKERVFYIGIGINVSEVLVSWGWTKTSKVFNYIQLPYTYIPFTHDFNSDGYATPYSRP